MRIIKVENTEKVPAIAYMDGTLSLENNINYWFEIGYLDGC